jgi:hypothetical protein
MASVQNLQRMPGSQDPARPGIAYQPVDTGDGSVLLKAGSNSRSRRRCIDTQGSFFNLVVAIVLCANAIFLCLEADLDMLSVDAPHGDRPRTGVVSAGGNPGVQAEQWGGLESDMRLVGMKGDEQANLEADIQEGLQADDGIKAKVQQKVDSMSLEDVDVQDNLKSGAYNVFEFFFITFYLLELFARVCDLGCSCEYGYWSDPWSIVDVFVVLFGLVDLAIPLVSTMSDKPFTEQFLRAMRVLRILRLLRVCAALRAVGRAFLNALYAVVWIFALISIINLVCSILLTTFIGQRAYLWNEHAAEVYTWFGSIGRSMVTLSSIMTLSGWDHIAEVLVNVIPRLVVMCVIFLYILVCGFTMLGLIVGLINASLIATHLDEEKNAGSKALERRASFASNFTDVLETCEQAKIGYLSRDEFKAALDSHPIVFRHLKTLGIDTSVEGLLSLYDRLSADPNFDGIVKIDHLVEATIHLSGTANASGVFDLKYQFLGMRRDTTKQLADVAKDLGAKHEISKASTEARVDELQSKVEMMQREVSSAVQLMAAVSQKIESSEKLEEQARAQQCWQNDALLATNSKLDTLFGQLNSTVLALTSRVAAQSSVVEKIDAMSAQIAQQAASNQRALDLAGQLAAAHTTVHEKVDGISNDFNKQVGAIERLHSLYEESLKTANDESTVLVGKEGNIGKKETSLLEYFIGTQPIEKSMVETPSSEKDAVSLKKTVEESSEEKVAVEETTVRQSGEDADEAEEDEEDEPQAKGKGKDHSKRPGKGKSKGKDSDVEEPQSVEEGKQQGQDSGENEAVDPSSCPTVQT